MDIGQLGAGLGGLAIGAALGAGLLAWKLGRELAGAKWRQAQLEAARQLLSQQNTQARRQLEQVQQELAALRSQAAGRAAQGQAPVRQAAPALQPDPPSEAEPADDGFVATQLLPLSRGDDFAPTQQFQFRH
ncbi:hypothetical protein [Roseateles violae]|uniref:DUF1043 family protein n=1 Tax=Roseateles violae TaxID=3058042 RepID=A0ABT8DZ95_9BURK|nr:hypothetical protein [Pelomonas sp. PFR6]MDN3922879.1 hypothetical protein [Pelomonas sp. PFR6]